MSKNVLQLCPKSACKKQIKKLKRKENLQNGDEKKMPQGQELKEKLYVIWDV